MFIYLLNKPQQCALEDLQTLAAEAKANLNPNLRKTGLVFRFEQEEYESGLKLQASDDHDATDDKDAKDVHKHAKDYNDANTNQDSNDSVGIG